MCFSKVKWKNLIYNFKFKKKNPERSDLAKNIIAEIRKFKQKFQNVKKIYTSTFDLNWDDIKL